MKLIDEIKDDEEIDQVFDRSFALHARTGLYISPEQGCSCGCMLAWVARRPVDLAIVGKVCWSASLRWNGAAEGLDRLALYLGWLTSRCGGVA